MTRGGGGTAYAEDSACANTGLILETWNVGWMRHIVEGSLRRTAVGLMTCVIENGPTYWGASLRVPPLMGMSFVESHTRSPTR